jgi:peptidoglycan DL-endopeptidase LytE
MRKKLFGLTATAVVGSSLFASMAAAESVKVKSGDTLWELSNTYNISVNSIKDTNGLTSDFLRIGQVLEIPVVSKQTTSTPVSSTKTTQTQTNYKVKSGDSLWVIARANNTTVNDLKKLNGLTSDLIRVGQNLIVKKVVGETVVNSNSNESIKQPTNTNSTYIVKSGDSLWKIANQNNLTVAEIKVVNNLSSDVIRIGQVLKLNGEAMKSPSSVNNSTNKNVIAPETQNSSSKIDTMISEAKSLMGTPYRWAGNTPSGFDCSGFIYYVLNKVTSVSRLSTAGYWDMMTSVSNPSVGDFVYFTTYKAGPSHMGIYLGNNEFIHASSSGVTISNLDNSYWKARYLGAKRL